MVRAQKGDHLDASTKPKSLQRIVLNWAREKSNCRAMPVDVFAFYTHIILIFQNDRITLF